MDDLDSRLIATLRIDGRAPLSKLAKVVGCSRGTVQNRLDRLIASGVITGFTVRLRDDATADRVRAVTMIEVTGKTTAKVVRALRMMPEIVALHTTNGAWDLVAEIEVSTLVEFDRVLNRIRMVDGISRTDTSLLLAAA
ncbi:MAG: Lrp/AsnC family transcriptional regulator [Pararhizobium sp.]